jgi:hypothetical protein|tara:strand:+ start:166 stop:492 length:327 start_codon:yes stop_codon:yes gene_type:complete
MKLLTKEIINKLETTKYDREELIPDDAPIIVKFFNPMGAGTWYALEGEKVNDDWVFFGFADLGNPDFAEYGEFVLSELEGIELPLGLGIERDKYFSGTHKDLKEKYNL